MKRSEFPMNIKLHKYIIVEGDDTLEFLEISICSTIAFGFLMFSGGIEMKHWAKMV